MNDTLRESLILQVLSKTWCSKKNKKNATVEAETAKKKQGKGKKPQASLALTEDEIKVHNENGILETSSPEAVLNSEAS
jgi:hypothetical protein